MTFQIFVGGVRVNSDFITNTTAWGGDGQQDKSRKRSCDEVEAPAMSCKRSASVYTTHQGFQQNYVLQPMTNQHQ